MIKHLLLTFSILFLAAESKSQLYALQWQLPVTSPKNLLVDSMGNSYVVEGTLLKKYNTASVFGGQNSSIGNVPVTLKFDNAGNVIAAGTKTNSASPLNDFFVCKIDVNGNLLWSRTLDSLNLNNNLTSFTIDNNDNIILSGNTIFSSTNSDALTFKISPAGNVIWCKSFSMLPGNTLDYVKVVNTDSLNNIFISQSVKTSTTTSPVIDSMAIIKYTSTGNFVAVNYFHGHPSYNFPLYSVNQSVFFNNKLYFYYQYDNNLPGLTSAYFTLDTNLTNVNHFIPMPPGPSAYLKQVMITDVKSYEKLNVLFTAGSETIAATPTGPTNYYPFLSVTTGSNYYNAYGSVPGGSQGILLPNGNYFYSFTDMTYSRSFYFIVNPTCSITQTISTKPYIIFSNMTTTYGLSSDKYNSVYILFTNASGSFLEKYALPLGISELDKNNSVQIYPNPTNSLINIEGVSENFSVEVYNSIGERIKSIQSTADPEVDLSQLARGIYFIRVNSSNVRFVQKIVKE
ncbi:MAG TPA: T9SS type A sorting domain-containing protein [Bacteroidia bacterium]|jgi:hypothetical protein|nr:T9SS type A sorting domain-containing protein [Bacteroidia bacterium]